MTHAVQPALLAAVAAAAAALAWTTRCISHGALIVLMKFVSRRALCSEATPCSANRKGWYTNPTSW